MLNQITINWFHSRHYNVCECVTKISDDDVDEWGCTEHSLDKYMREIKIPIVYIYVRYMGKYEDVEEAMSLGATEVNE